MLLTVSNPNSSSPNSLGNQVILLSSNITQPLVTVSQPLIASTFPIVANPMNSVGLPPLDPPSEAENVGSGGVSGLHKVLPQDVDNGHDGDVSKDSLSVSSETSFPVTPPKTPDDQLSEDSSMSVSFVYTCLIRSFD